MSSQMVSARASRQLETLNESLKSSNLPLVNSESFCVLPFMHLSTTTTGDIKLCCRSRNVDHVNSKNLSQVWESEQLQEIRGDLVRGVKRPECNACWRLEKLGMVSLRMGQNIMRLEENTKRISEWLESKQVRPLKNIELKLSNLCNLKCRMCSPVASTPWMRDWPKVKDYYSENDVKEINDSFNWQMQKKEPVLDLFMGNESFLKDFENISGDIEELEFAGGEPLLDPLHYEILKKVEDRAGEISLKYSSNLMVLGVGRHSVMELWPKFKSVKITISLDGPPKVNEYVRTGHKTAIFEENLKKVRALSNVSLKMSTCVSAYNVMFLVETLRYVASLGISWHSNRVSSPRFLDARILPSALRAQAVAQLNDIGIDDLVSMGLDEKQAQLSLRTVEDCASWISDTSLESVAKEEFAKFKGYAGKLDEIRKTNFSQFFADNEIGREYFGV